MNGKLHVCVHLFYSDIILHLHIQQVTAEGVDMTSSVFEWHGQEFIGFVPTHFLIVFAEYL